MAQVDDRVQMVAPKLGGHVREGVVTAVTGSLLRIKWSTGEESTVTSTTGSLRVTGRQAVPEASAPKRTAAPRKARKK